MMVKGNLLIKSAIMMLFFSIVILSGCAIGGKSSEKAQDAAMMASPKTTEPQEMPITSPQKQEERPRNSADSPGQPIIAAPAPAPVVKSTLTAGSHNDNEQFVEYLRYLQRPFVQNLTSIRMDVSERYIIQVKDASGKPIPNCQVTVRGASPYALAEFKTTASGEAIYFPRAMDNIPGDSEMVLALSLEYQGQTIQHQFSRGPVQVVTVQTPWTRSIPEQVPLDVVFVLDTTGSMGDEIKQLTDTLFLIHTEITSKMPLKPHVRFGMVLYRDMGDIYLNKVEPMTDNVTAFQNKLYEVEAGGGGDEPEELEQALYKTLTEQAWNNDGIREIFLITDAPPHVERANPNKYPWAMKEAARRGIKIHAVGASGLKYLGEYVMRQLSLFTQGNYIFLTYDETGESSDSDKAKVSHHTGANYEVKKLDQLIVQVIKKDLSYLVDPALVANQEIATPLNENAYTLDERIQNITDQLMYQAREKLAQPKSSIAVTPLQIDNPARLSKVAEYVQDGLTEQLRKHSCKLLDRQEVRKAIAERMASSGKTVMDEKEMSDITKVQGGDILFTGKVYSLGTSVILFMQLIDVVSLEKLAVARVLWTAE